jgi:hypothetical protein
MSDHPSLYGLRERLLASLRHVSVCRHCGEGSLEDCEGGRAALAVMEAAQAAPPGYRCPVCDHAAELQCDKSVYRQRRYVQLYCKTCDSHIRVTFRTPAKKDA